MKQVDAVNLHRSRPQVNVFALSREVVGAAAGDLGGGIRRRRLFDGADEAGQAGRDGRGVGRRRRRGCDHAVGVVGVAARAEA